MKNNGRTFAILIAQFVAVSLVLANCTSTPSPTLIPTVAPTPEPTAIPLQKFSLEPGQLYFDVNGQPGFFYSRNVAAFFTQDYGTELDWSAYGGTRVIRFGLVNIVGMGGYPYTNTGQLNESVIRNFESLIDDAEAHGIDVIFWITGWAQWNSTGLTDWAINPFNAVNGGPAQKPIEVFQPGTPANTMWCEFISRMVTRWQDRDNILAWDVLGEANLIQGIDEQQGMAFVEQMAEVIHAADSHQRPITASLGDVDTWWKFYNSDAIDFVQTHPYPTTLDRAIIKKVHQYIDLYHKPVMIGESGLNWEKPDEGVTTSPTAQIGIQHAIWAGVVSGAMNGRALFWEDGFAIYFPTMRTTFLNQYAETELPAARFTRRVNFTDFAPLTVHFADGTKIWGAAVGNETHAIGWFRDAQSEPPNWNLLPNITGQAVSLEVPGLTQNWQVDFYDTKTGNALGGSTLLVRQGNLIKVTLPDFSDDIAFKLYANNTGAIIPSTKPEPEPASIALSSTEPMAGQWVGTVFEPGNGFANVLSISILPDCKVGGVCGKSKFSWCSLDLILKDIDGDTLSFAEQNINNSAPCAVGGYDHLRLQPDGTILLNYDPGSSGAVIYNGILRRP